MIKSKYNLLLLLLLLAFASCSFTAKTTLNDSDKDKNLIQVITYVLEQGHFNPKTMDDEFSKEVFDDYLKALDPLKRYFYQSDIDDFKKYETQLDDQLKKYDISFFNLTYDRLLKRIAESKKIYEKQIGKPFDFNRDETFNSDYENAPYVNSKKQMRERWRKQLKFTTISNYYELIKEQETPEKNEDGEEIEEKKEPKTPEQMELEAREETKEALNTFYNDYLNDLQRKDWFSMYVNAIVEEFDPHTFYLAPKDKDKFDQQMSGKFEGIGARLQKQMGNIKVMGIISGGPAWYGKDLEVGDIIQKVRQEDEDMPVSISGMRIDDAIKLIKGPKGTKVYLTLKKVDGTVEEIEIIRDLVELEETYAKSSIVEKNNQKFGVINLPKFYVDFKDYKSKNASDDVKKEIQRLQKEGVEGLVLDLRNNGGGSLQTVVDMAGLFIKDGPIVQVRSSGMPKDVLADKDKSIVWDGPLVIMVNELSASASEILAAAMQDYKRAIIIGSKQTYGKGTVQQILDLNGVVRNNKHGDLGAMKLTTQKFYRVNGGSTQLEGVKSDVIVPDRYSFIDVGEKDQENPLPWDKIEPVAHTIWDSYFDYKGTIDKSKERMSANEQLKLIEDNAKWVKTQMDEKVHPLNFEKYRFTIEEAEKESKRFEKLSDYKTNLTFESLPYEKELFENDSILKEKRVRWHENLSKDVYMEEALNVLSDLKMSYSIKKVAKLKD